MAKQILNVRDVMAALEVSESKAYGIIKQLNSELSAKGYIVIPGKVSRAYFEEKLYGVRIAEERGTSCQYSARYEAHLGFFQEYLWLLTI